jgi:hypothetical protein
MSRGREESGDGCALLVLFERVHGRTMIEYGDLQGADRIRGGATSTLNQLPVRERGTVMSDDYWLALAVYDEFRGVPVRKAIARGYIDLKPMVRERQEQFIRLGSLFFQGRSWRKFADDRTPDPVAHLTPAEEAELRSFLALRHEVGAAVVRLLDEDENVDPVLRDVTVERLESMGFLDGDYEL